MARAHELEHAMFDLVESSAAASAPSTASAG
jgi:hypothetical protein